MVSTSGFFALRVQLHPFDRPGIHTRFPIVGKERIDYRSVANGSVAFYLKIADDTVIVINNHLESTHLSTAERNRYKEVLKGEMEQEEAEEEMLEALPLCAPCAAFSGSF